MKLLKKSICVLIALSIASTLAGCGPKRIEHKYLISTCEDKGYTEFDKDYKFESEYGKVTDLDAEGYINCSGKEAENTFSLITYNNPDFEDYKVNEITALVISNEEGFYYANVITFKTSSEAEDFFNDYSDSMVYLDDEYDLTEDSGKGSDYYYKTLCQEFPSDRYFMSAAYYADDSVLLIRAFSQDTSLCRDICRNFGVASPLG